MKPITSRTVSSQTNSMKTNGMKATRRVLPAEKLARAQMARKFTPLALSGFLLCLGAVGHVAAEIKSRPQLVNPALAEQTEEDGTGRINLPQERSNLRCWQEGTLLFEEVNVEQGNLEKARQVLFFKASESSDPSELFLIETGSATCLFKKV